MTKYFALASACVLFARTVLAGNYAVVLDAYYTTDSEGYAMGRFEIGIPTSRSVELNDKPSWIKSARFTKQFLGGWVYMAEFTYALNTTTTNRSFTATVNADGDTLEIIQKPISAVPITNVSFRHKDGKLDNIKIEGKANYFVTIPVGKEGGVVCVTLSNANERVIGFVNADGSTERIFKPSYVSVSANQPMMCPGGEYLESSFVKTFTSDDKCRYVNCNMCTYADFECTIDYRSTRSFCVEVRNNEYSDVRTGTIHIAIAAEGTRIADYRIHVIQDGYDGVGPRDLDEIVMDGPAELLTGETGTYQLKIGEYLCSNWYLGKFTVTDPSGLAVTKDILAIPGRLPGRYDFTPTETGTYKLFFQSDVVFFDFPWYDVYNYAVKMTRYVSVVQGYSVRFNIGEKGVRTGGGLLRQSVKYGASASAPEVTALTGFRFVGWDTSFADVTRNLVVTALYQPISYSVRFDANGGSGKMEKMILTYNCTTNLQANAFHRAYCHFDGWATNSTGIAVYEDCAEVSNLSSKHGDVVTLYAKWVADAFKVRFNLGEKGTRSGGGALVQVVERGSAASAPNVKAVDGYEFVGWDRTFDSVDSDFVVTALYRLIPPVPPVLLSVTRVEGAMRLCWSGVPWAEQYAIYRSPGGKRPDEAIAFVSADTTEYLDETAIYGREYCYWVAAVGDDATAISEGRVATCTINWDANGGVCTETTRTLKIGGFVGVFPVVTNANPLMKFDGWYTEKVGGDQITVTTIVAQDATGYAHWHASAEITWWSYDGDGGTKEIEKNIGEELGTLTLLTPPYDYYGSKNWGFDGWWTAREGGERVQSTFIVTNSVTYYAHYSILWYRAEGDGVVVNGCGWYVADIVIPSTYQGSNVTGIAYSAFERSKYITSVHIPASITNIGSHAFSYCSNLSNVYFYGDAPTVGYWGAFDGVARNCVVTVYSGTKGWDDDGDGKWQGLTLVYRPITYRVRFDPNGGFGTMPDMLMTYDVETNLTSNAFVREGYHFAGWATSQGGDVVYGDMSEVRNLIAVQDAQVVLFAKWEVNRYSVRFDLGDWGTRTGGGELEQSVEHGASALAPEVAVAEGYMLSGWEGAYSQVTGERVVKALYRPISYGLRFDANGGTGEMADMRLTFDAETNLTSNAFVREGYHFAGWATSQGGDVVYGDMSEVRNLIAVQDAQVVLFAKWEAYRYSVRFDANSGTGEMADMWLTFNVETNLTANAFVREGYRFMGWATVSEGDVSYLDRDTVLNLSSQDGGEVRVFAVWNREVVPDGEYTKEVDGITWRYTILDGNAVIVSASKAVIHAAISPCETEDIVIPMEFYGCPVIGIADYAFDRSEMTSVAIPSSVTTIGAYAFYCCERLTSVTIPSSVASIGKCAFAGCSSLQAIDVAPDSMSYASHDGVLFNAEKTVLVACPGGKSWIGDMPTTVTSIGDGAFWGCNSLRDIYIPSGVVDIGDSAFEGCYNLMGIDLPEGLITIGNASFCDCEWLQCIAIPSSVTSIGCRAFEGCSGLTSVTISEGVTTIDDNAFCLCKGLMSVTIPSSVTRIGRSAFYACSGLTSVTISEGVTDIGAYAFYCCERLTSVTIPSSVTSIGEWAFACCNGLTSVTIPEGVMSIGSYAFYGCNSLNAVDFEGAPLSGVQDAQFRTDAAFRYNVAYEDKWLSVIQQCGWTNARPYQQDPSVPSDPDAIVTGNAENGYTITPSEGKKIVEVTIPDGVEPEKVTVVLGANVESVKPNGANVKIMKGTNDITGYLDIPAADPSGTVDLTEAAVKEEIVKETLDPEKGAKIVLNPEAPKLTTSKTKSGLTYTLKEGRTLKDMTPGDSKLGDGQPWTPNLTIKGGKSGFYSIGVTK